MRPGWSRWVSVHSYALSQRGLAVASSRVARSDELLKQSHLVSFSLIPLVCVGQGCEVPAFAGTTKGLRRNDAYNHCKGWRGDGAMGVCRRMALGEPVASARAGGSDPCQPMGPGVAGRPLLSARSCCRHRRSAQLPAGVASSNTEGDALTKLDGTRPRASASLVSFASWRGHKGAGRKVGFERLSVAVAL